MPQCAGATREGLLTYTTLDASQHSQGGHMAKPLNTCTARDRLVMPNIMPCASPAAITPPAVTGASGYKEPLRAPSVQPSNISLAERSAVAVNLHSVQPTPGPSPLQGVNALPEAGDPGAQQQQMQGRQNAGHTTAAAVHADKPLLAAPIGQAVDSKQHCASNSQEGDTHSHKLHTDSIRSTSPVRLPTHIAPAALLHRAALGMDTAVDVPNSQHSTSQRGIRLTSVSRCAAVPATAKSESAQDPVTGLIGGKQVSPPNQAGTKHDKAQVQEPVTGLTGGKQASPPDQAGTKQGQVRPSSGSLRASAILSQGAERAQQGRASEAVLQQISLPGKASEATRQQIGLPGKAVPAATGGQTKRGAASHGDWQRKQASSDSRDAQTTTKAGAQQASAAGESAAADTCATPTPAGPPTSTPAATAQLVGVPSSSAEHQHQEAPAQAAQPASALLTVHQYTAKAAALDAAATGSAKLNARGVYAADSKPGSQNANSVTALDGMLGSSQKVYNVTSADSKPGGSQKAYNVTAALDSKLGSSQNAYSVTSADRKPGGSQRAVEGSVEGSHVRTGGWAGKLKSLFSLANKGELCCAFAVCCVHPHCTALGA